MSKIYSRPRIRIPYTLQKCKNKLKTPKGKKRLTILIIIIIAVSTAKLILDAIYPMFDTLCEHKAMSIATMISNEQATNVMSNYSYNDMFIIEKDTEGKIAMIRSNVITINEIISDVAVKIQEELDKRGRENIQIPLGSITGIKLLAGEGPGINIKITPIGSVETDLRSEFTAQGINQTLHRVYLQVDCEVSILTPFQNISKKISNQVLLVENVIVGTIPDAYYNLDGLTGTNDALEMIN